MAFTIDIRVDEVAAEQLEQLSADMQNDSFKPVRKDTFTNFMSFNYRGNLPITEIVKRVATVLAGSGNQYSFTVRKTN
ncbi:MAG: hypothetical protein ACK4E0_09210 [Chitinophagaceae bacterium]